MKFISSKPTSILALLAAASSIQCTHAHGYNPDPNILEGNPACFCLDGTVVMKSKRDVEGPSNGTEVTPFKPPFGRPPCRKFCADHGGCALTYDSEQELTVNCNDQECEKKQTMGPFSFVLGFPDIPEEVNANNAGMVHNAIVHQILSAKPRNQEELKKIAEDMMTKARISKWKIKFTIKFLWFELEITWEGGGGGGGRRLMVIDEDREKDGDEDFLDAVIQSYRWESAAAWDNGVIDGGCTPNPELFDFLRHSMGLLGQAEDIHEFILTSTLTKGFIPDAAEECSKDIMETYLDFAPSTYAFWKVRCEQEMGGCGGHPRSSARAWPWVADLVGFAGALSNGYDVIDSVFIGAIASARKFLF